MYKKRLKIHLKSKANSYEDCVICLLVFGAGTNVHLLHGDVYTQVVIIYATYWSFVEKTSVKQSMKRKVCSNFQVQMYPPVEASGGQEQNYVRSA